ncbi:AAA domain-containing protein [uncultured Bacteroides sp.]|nr:AAA domain-containing protein [uncultured Bacteroides sp.]
MFISLVHANKNRQIVFFNDFRRMNVSTTRARMKLTIIGNASTLASHTF